MPLELQTKLLRVLQDGKFERLAYDLTGPARNQIPSPLKSLPAIETDRIIRILEETIWRIDGAKGAALILDMNPSTLRSRLRKLGIKKQ